MSLFLHYINLLFYYFSGYKYPEKKIYDSYFISHKSHKKFFNRNESKKKVIFMCDGLRNHGGFTDRMKGLLSSFILAKDKNYDFYVYWKSPFYLEKYLEPNSNFDWRIRKEDLNFSKSKCKVIVVDTTGYKIKNKINEYFFKRIISQKYENLVYSNFIINKDNFALAYQKLFKPTEILENCINTHLDKLGSNYWSFSFRFGNLLNDFKDLVGYPLKDNEKIALINKNKEELLSLMKDLPYGFKAFITSDSYTFLSSIKNLDDKIYIIDEKIYHPEYFSVEQENIDPWLKLFLDHNLIMRAQKVFLLKTGNMYKSAFAEYAALLGNKEYIFHEY